MSITAGPPASAADVTHAPTPPITSLQALSPDDKGATDQKNATQQVETKEAEPDDPGPSEKSDAPDVLKRGPARAQFVWEEHPSFRYGTIFRIDFEAKFQEDFHQSYDGADTRAGLSTFELHRNRIGIQGALFKHLEFEVERELTEKELTADELTAGLTPRSPWKDVNVNVDYLDNVQVRAGRFKIPFGLDELTSVAQGDFVYRSLGADYLAPARDIGVMAHGRFFKRGLNYWTGVFTHDGDNARSKKIQGGNETLAVRVTGTPLRPLAWARGTRAGGRHRADRQHAVERLVPAQRAPRTDGRDRGHLLQPRVREWPALAVGR